MPGIDQTNEQREQAQSLLNQTFGRTLKVQSHIWAFQLFMVHGSPSALTGLLEQAEKSAIEHVMGPNFGAEEERRPYLENLGSYVEGATLDTVQNAHATAEASCIVFAHSMLDAAVLDYCRVGAMMNADDWSDWVENDKFTLRQIREAGPDQLLREAVEALIKKLSNKSLLHKIEALQKVCRPGPAEIRRNYRFDEERIRRIDDLRTQSSTRTRSVHESRLSRTI